MILLNPDGRCITVRASIEVKRKSPDDKCPGFFFLVENIGLEPITSTLPALRSSQMS